jgi:glucose/arabinose dehydrogenase
MSHVRPAALLLALAVATVSCNRPDSAKGAADSTTAAAAGQPAADPGVTFAPGFTGSIFADSLGLARHVAVAPEGDVYINTWRSPYDTARRIPPGGFIVALRDSNRDGRADVIERFGQTSEEGGRGGTGIAVYHGAVYAEAGPSILRYRLTPGELVPQGAPDTIVTGLATEGGHPMHPFAIDSQGNLLVNSGSHTNSCQVKDREPESPGRRPCPDLTTSAGIWRFDANRTRQRFTPAARYATGIRNAGGLAVTADGRFYVTQHGRDQLAANWPKLYDWKQSADLPAEELIRVERGGDYGWPYCYYDQNLKTLVLAPEYGGDGKKIGECAEKGAPAAVYPGHWAPNGLAFGKDGAFIAFHGSWNRAPEPQQGYNVVFQPFTDGQPSGEYRIIADGFAGARKEPGLAAHRPAGVAVGPDGALYITDDSGGRVWRVVR